MLSNSFNVCTSRSSWVGWSLRPLEADVYSIMCEGQIKHLTFLGWIRSIVVFLEAPPPLDASFGWIHLCSPVHMAAFTGRLAVMYLCILLYATVLMNAWQKPKLLLLQPDVLCMWRIAESSVKRKNQLVLYYLCQENLESCFVWEDCLTWTTCWECLEPWFLAVTGHIGNIIRSFAFQFLSLCWNVLLWCYLFVCYNSLFGVTVGQKGI